MVINFVANPYLLLQLSQSNNTLIIIQFEMVINFVVNPYLLLQLSQFRMCLIKTIQMFHNWSGFSSAFSSTMTSSNQCKKTTSFNFSFFQKKYDCILPLVKYHDIDSF